MTTSKSLPARPSLESLRKQAKKLARDITAGDAGAIARARLQLPHVDLPLTQRNFWRAPVPTSTLPTPERRPSSSRPRWSFDETA